MRAASRLAAALLVVGLALQPAQAEDAFDAARDAWQASRRHEALDARVLAHDTLAATGDPRAIRDLRQAYYSPRSPKDQERYLLASIATAHLHGRSSLAAYDAWRRSERTAEDAWLWYRTLLVAARAGEPDKAAHVARESGNAWLRAAALEALATARAPEGLAVALEVLDAPGGDALTRSLLVEGASSVAYAFADRRHDPEPARLVAALVRKAAEPGLPARTHVVLKRRLREILGTAVPRGDADPSPAAPNTPAVAVDGDRYAPPSRSRFFGIEASGERIAYVIDVSVSMSTRLTAEEREALQDVVARADASRSGRPRPTRMERRPEPVPTTRFDAARACLRLSLEALAPHQRFTVIAFGSEAGPLVASHLMPATPGNIRNVLDRLRDGPDGDRGSLTNLHGGLRRAFLATTGVPAGRGEYVDRRAHLQGCDSIFVLSDGMPCVDDWSSGLCTRSTPLAFDREIEIPRFATYSVPHQLADDIERLNLFRKAEIHCIAIGEANGPLLWRLASIGHGRLVRLGATESAPGNALPEGLRVVVHELRFHDDESRRAGAAAALARMQAVDTVPYLIRALDDPSVVVRRAAADALRDLCGHDEPFDPDGDYDNRAATQQAWRAWFAEHADELRQRLAPR